MAVGCGFNCPWGKFGIHGTTEIYSVGWSSSHGCIRMNNDEVAKLYKIIPIGTKVGAWGWLMLAHVCGYSFNYQIVRQCPGNLCFA